jgi:hypothetical protein
MTCDKKWEAEFKTRAMKTKANDNRNVENARSKTLLFIKQHKSQTCARYWDNRWKQSFNLGM